MKEYSCVVLSVATLAARSPGPDAASTSPASWLMSRLSSVAPASNQVLTHREALRESILAREIQALERLAAATGGQSLCALSGGGGPVPAVKYYEGAAAALAEARRAIRRLPDLPDDDDDASRLAIRDIRARWEA